MTNIVGTKKFILGGAQIGLDYGIANVCGLPTRIEVEELLSFASRSNILAIDTAAAYGNSEEKIGEAFSSLPSCKPIITKLEPLCGFENESNELLGKSIDKSVMTSIARLKVSSLDTLLLHRAEQLHARDGFIWDRLLAHKQDGVIRRLGVSVQTPEELISALDAIDVSVIQFPYNLFDHRWDEAFNLVSTIKKARPLELHVRSVLLQGLITSSDSDLWRKANVPDSDEINSWIDQTVGSLGRIDRVDLCIAFVSSRDLIDGIVMGVDNIDQLQMNLSYFERPPLDQSQFEMIVKERPTLRENTLNPALWS